MSEIKFGKEYIMTTFILFLFALFSLNFIFLVWDKGLYDKQMQILCIIICLFVGFIFLGYISYMICR
jgi:hypothetical protein